MKLEWKTVTWAWSNTALECAITDRFILRIEPQPQNKGFCAAIVGGGPSAIYRSRRTFATVEEAQAQAISAGIKSAARISKTHMGIVSLLRKVAVPATIRYCP